MSFDLSDYVDVASRIKIFGGKHPDGSLQSEITFINDGTTYGVLCKAWAFRDIGDETPGIGHSFLAIPGTTPYTKGSEVENAETSAWGRAIVAALAADTHKVASADEVRSKQTADPPEAPPRQDRGGAAAGESAKPAAANLSPGNTFVWPSGKHQGKTLADTPIDYLEWYVDKGPKPDVRAICNEYLTEGALVGVGATETPGSSYFNPDDHGADAIPF